MQDVTKPISLPCCKIFIAKSYAYFRTN